uniref:Putative secreted protein n=1 Tax=Anopheles marajoara TaxID=58244 RepID=A0A2M4C843_9DIPT
MFDTFSFQVLVIWLERASMSLPVRSLVRWQVQRSCYPSSWPDSCRCSRPCATPSLAPGSPRRARRTSTRTFQSASSGRSSSVGTSSWSICSVRPPLPVLGVATLIRCWATL